MTPHTPWPFTPAAAAAAEEIRARAKGAHPKVAIIAGSGLSSLAEQLTKDEEIAYRDLPGFPFPLMAGHDGRLLLGRLAAVAVALLLGRRHYYEGEQADAMRCPLESLHLLGCRCLVVTNAAGSLCPQDLPPGRLMLITDHINLVQRSPLAHCRGSSELFVDLRHAYDRALRTATLAAARSLNLTLAQGVYCWLCGPQFETPAEISMVQRLGAHAVGMSTVPEVILARALGWRVLGLSLITNLAAGLDDHELSHQQTLAVAGQNDHLPSLLKRLFTNYLYALADD